jgi:hypothetical protein
MQFDEFEGACTITLHTSNLILGNISEHGFFAWAIIIHYGSKPSIEPTKLKVSSNHIPFHPI